MKKITYIILFLFFFEGTTAQNKEIDSLKIELEKSKAKDTIRVKLLNSIAFKYFDTQNLVEAEKAAIEANTLSKQLDFKKGEAASAYIFCRIHMNKYQNDEAKEDCMHALKLYQEVGNANGILTVYNNLGIIAIQKNDPDLSADYFTKAFEVAKENGNLKKQSEMLYNIGNVFYKKGDYDEAIKYYKKTLNLNEEIGNKDIVQSISNNIAGIYLKQGRSTEALKMFNQNLQMCKDNGNIKGVALANINISTLVYELEQYEKAIEYSEKALDIYRKIDDKQRVATCLVLIGAAYSGLNNKHKALKYLNESLAINEAIDNKYGISETLHQLGGLYKKMNEPNKAISYLKRDLIISESLNAKVGICNSHISLTEAYIMLKDYSNALYHAKEGEKLANELQLLQERKIVNDLLFQIYEAKNDDKKALNYHKQYKTLSDSLFNKEKIEKIAQIESEYKYKRELDSIGNSEIKLKKTVQTTSKDLEKSKRNLLLGIITFLAIAMILGSIIFFLKLRNSKAKTQNIITEQKLLRTQMTPHFIFNSLSVLQGMILNKEENKSVGYLSKFSKLLRITLENSRDKTVLLSQELEAVENYLSLQNIENEKITFQLHVDDAIEANAIKVPPMLIQPFVENAIEHAFKNQKENCIIEIKLNLVDSKLICVILDNGMGIDSSERNSNQNKKSLATKITKERLDYLSKDFKMDASITIEDRTKYNAQGTQVTIQMPYSKTES